MKQLLILFAFATAAMAADPFFFMQASDPQFGMFTADRSFEQESSNWEFVIANANRLKPAFLIVTGDLTNRQGDAAQIAEYKKICARLATTIHLYAVAGNHDVGNFPTPATLQAFRKVYGPDYYSFREGPVYGIVLNSSLFKAPEQAVDEAEKQEQWLRLELVRGQASGAQIVVFQHIPFFLEQADEPDQYFNIPMATRRRILALLQNAGVRYVFAGHYHRNAYGRAGALQMITTAAAGMPIGPDPSGFRLAWVNGGAIDQNYFPFGAVPAVFPAPAPEGK